MIMGDAPTQPTTSDSANRAAFPGGRVARRGPSPYPVAPIVADGGDAGTELNLCLGAAVAEEPANRARATPLVAEELAHQHTQPGRLQDKVRASSPGPSRATGTATYYYGG